MFDELAKGLVILGWIVVMSVPLAIWKLIDIVIWLAHHVVIR